MRIACVTSSWPTRENPIAGAFVRRWAQVIEAAGHTVTVFTWRPGTHDDDVIVVSPFGARSMFAGDGAPDALDGAPWRALEAPVAIGAMLLELARHPPFDLYVGHWFVPGGLVARLAADRVGRPSLVIGHSAGIHAVTGLPRRLRAPLRRTIVREGSTTVPSVALAVKVGLPVDVLPMGFDPVAIDERAERRGVLCYGRLVPLKGFDIAARAARGLDLDLHIVGAGPEEATLRRLAPTAKFWGYADAALKSEAFAQCDRALFPSRVHRGRHEGWPVSVLEVASAGVVPFVADWPGSDELVVDPRRQVIRGDWSSALAVDVNPELRSAGVQLSRRYTWDALAARWSAVIDQATCLQSATFKLQPSIFNRAAVGDGARLKIGDVSGD